MKSTINNGNEVWRTRWFRCFFDVLSVFCGIYLWARLFTVLPRDSELPRSSENLCCEVDTGPSESGQHSCKHARLFFGRHRGPDLVTLIVATGGLANLGKYTELIRLRFPHGGQLRWHHGPVPPAHSHGQGCKVKWCTVLHQRGKGLTGVVGGRCKVVRHKVMATCWE